MQSSMLRHITEDFGNGGTIDGDLTISGDLTVSGGGSLSFDEIIEGTSVIDVTDTEAFLVRKDGDGGDVFVVDTSNSRVGINKTSPDEALHLSGNVKLFESGNTADKTYSSTGAGLFLTSYQSDSGSPYTKTSDIVAGSDGTVPSEIRFFTRTSGDANLTNALTIDSSQRVGIGLNNPSKPLHIYSSDNAPLRVQSTDAYSGIEFRDNTSSSLPPLISALADDFIIYGGNASLRPTILTLTSSSQLATFAGNLALSASSPQINFSGSAGDYGTFGYTEGDPDVFKWALFQNSGQLSSITMDAVSEASPSARFRFNVGGDTDTALMIDSSKRIGIGITPTNHLHVFGATANGVATFESGDAKGGIALKDNSTSNNVFLLAEGDDFFIQTGGSENRLRVESNGNVGIGGSPDTLLHLQGNNGNASHTLLKIHNNDETSNTETGQTADIEFNFQGTTNGGSSFVTKNAGAIRAGKDSDYFTSSADNMDSHLKFYTAQDNTNTLALTIDSSQHATFAQNINLGDDKALTLGSDGDSQIFNTGSHLFIRNNTSDQDIIFQVNDGGSTQTEVMRIDASVPSVNIASDVTIGASGNNGLINLKRSSDGVTVGAMGLSSTNVLDLSVSGGSTPLIQSIIGGTTIMKLDTDSRISLSNNDSGSSNTLFGFRAGNAIADVGNTGNVLIGHNAGKVANNADFHYNVGIGYATLQSVGSRNLKNVVAIGTNTMRSCDSGAPDGTVAIGSSSLYSLTTGEKNVAIGFESMLYQTDGANNTVLGYNALRNADNGESDNVVIGKEAGININHASSDANVIIGSNAGFGGNAPMSGSVAIGANAMNSTGANTQTGTVAVGYNSLTDLTSGANNVAMGYQSGDTITTGSGNTIIGTYADAGTNAQNQIVIGHNVTGLADNSVTLGNASVTNVYLSTDRDARLHCGGVDLGESSPSSDANVLDDYEEGDWTITDTSGAGLSLTVLSNKYIKVGRQVTATANVTFPTTSDTTVVSLSLPFTASSTGSVSGGAVLEQNISVSNHYTACVDGANALKFRIRGVTSQTYANLSGKRFKFIITYHTVD